MAQDNARPEARPEAPVFRNRLLARFYPVIIAFVVIPVVTVAIVTHSPSPGGGRTPPSHAMTIAPSGPDGGPLGIPGDWNLIFDSEFAKASSLDQVDRGVWRFGGPEVAGQVACYSPDNVTFPGDGTVQLGITAAWSSCGGRAYPYTSASINTNPAQRASGGNPGFEYTYGVMEAQVYVPPSSGGIANWPALWTTSRDWPAGGENDVMEGLGGDACFHFHHAAPSGKPVASGSCVVGGFTGWHTFASDWENRSVTYYYDGNQVGKITSGITSSPMFLVIDDTIGSQGGRTTAPSGLQVRYVKVWQRGRGA